MSLTNYKAPLLLQNILLQMTKTKIQEMSEREKDLKKNPNFSRWIPLSVVLQGYLQEIQEVESQYNSPTKTRNQSYPKGRVFAAIAWPLLVRSSGLLLLDVVFKPSILRTRDNLGSKLSQIRIYKRICSLSLSFSPLLSLSLYCKQPSLSLSLFKDNDPSYPFPPLFSNQEFYFILPLLLLDFKLLI